MKKLSTLFEKDPNDLGRVINKVNTENQWVFKHGRPTQKFDGTSCAIIDGELYKRFDLKRGRVLPSNSIACQEPDEITGHHPHWVKCDRKDNSNEYHFIAFNNLRNKEDGTYELCGEKVQSNPENIKGHELIKHGIEELSICEYDFGTVKKYLEITDIEGIVFHHIEDGRMCKIRKSDFSIKRKKQ